jgi:hypothetical protein
MTILIALGPGTGKQKPGARGTSSEHLFLIELDVKTEEGLRIVDSF